MRAGLAAPSKAPFDIPGLDAVTRGGLPREHATMICGGAGGAKPDLARKSPPPLKRIIGDQSNTERVIAGLDPLEP